MSDELRRIRDKVSRHPRLGIYAPQIDVCQEGSRAILTGKLPSYFLKQLFQEIVHREAHGGAIENSVEVCDDSWLPQSPDFFRR